MKSATSPPAPSRSCPRLTETRTASAIETPSEAASSSVARMVRGVAQGRRPFAEDRYDTKCRNASLSYNGVFGSKHETVD